MKKFLLIGIGGVYNYGCEAIVRGTAKLLRDLRPDAEIYYASPRPEDDRQRLSDCAIKVITRRRIFRYSPKNVARKLLGYCGIRYRPCCDPPRQAEGMDAVFSIGGDIYTLTNSSDFNTSIVKFGDAVLAKRVPYILWGASVGPFSNAPMIEQMLKRHLARLSAIVAREHRTIRYLESLGITDNVTFYPDPAFFVDTDIVKREHDCHNHNKLIGINLSPLSVRHLNIPLEKALMDQASAIVAIANEFGADVVLIPHVWCSFSERDDDFRYLQKVKESIPRSHQDRVHLVRDDPGFIRLRKTLIKCDIVIAARMHCAINAISANVPTLFLSYSEKSRGMCELIYGHERYVIPVKSFSSAECLSVLGDLWNERVDLRKRLFQRMQEFRALSSTPLTNVLG